MSDWRESLGEIGLQVKEDEKRKKERREAEKAEKLRAEERLRLAHRLMDKEIERDTREPINLEAAKLIRPAPDWAKPPPESPEAQLWQRRRDILINEKREHEGALRRLGKILRSTLPYLRYKEYEAKRQQHIAAIVKIEAELAQHNNKEKDMSDRVRIATGTMVDNKTGENRDKVHPTSLGGNSGVPLGRNPEEYFNFHEVAVRVIEDINKTPQSLTPLARAAIDARSALREALDGFGVELDEFNQHVKMGIEDVRNSRFALVSEAATMAKSLREVRQFFIDKDYEKEINRLREFVELCERLVALKKDGTLDAVSDTMLRLAVG
jgi:hypothetical protein